MWSLFKVLKECITVVACYEQPPSIVFPLVVKHSTAVLSTVQIIIRQLVLQLVLEHYNIDSGTFWLCSNKADFQCGVFAIAVATA